MESRGWPNWQNEMRRLTEKGRPSIIYDGRGRSLWIFFTIINADCREDKFLIISLLQKV